jgi:hypothetical protein
MTGQNGQNGDNTRLDRIEALVDRMAGQQAALYESHFALIDDFKEFKRETLTYQVLAADEFRAADERLSKKIDDLRIEMKELGEKTDRRIADLISAIGRLIANTPPGQQPSPQSQQ